MNGIELTWEDHTEDRYDREGTLVAVKGRSYVVRRISVDGTEWGASMHTTRIPDEVDGLFRDLVNLLRVICNVPEPEAEPAGNARRSSGRLQPKRARGSLAGSDAGASAAPP
jgi:hypothetical protein